MGYAGNKKKKRKIFWSRRRQSTIKTSGKIDEGDENET
jgi:hypothetical protein